MSTFAAFESMTWQCNSLRACNERVGIGARRFDQIDKRPFMIRLMELERYAAK
jgi:hypothetical protein